jgi:hypothetical protein
MQYKVIELICSGPGCGEPFTYHRPKGKRGPNPKTNPEHPRCSVKRQNKNRALSRARKRDGVETFYWNPRKSAAPVEIGDLTPEEREQLMDSLDRPWWKSGTAQDMPKEGWHWVDQEDPDLVAVDLKSLTKEERKLVKGWMAESRAHAMSGWDVGQTRDPKLPSLPLLGSTTPWHLVDIPHPGTNRRFEPLKPFVWQSVR